MKTLKTTVLLLVALSGALVLQPAQAAKLRDLAQVDGARSNQLIGFGLVGGLAGTGDDPKSAPYTAEAIANLMGNQGFQVDARQIKVKNFAAVMVTADLPPFLKSGDTLDVTISAVGSAKSLSGGVLYQTILKGADGQIYAAAQGELSLGSQVGSGGSRGAKPHLTVGRISAGALIENSVPSTMLKDDGAIRLNLSQPDFTTASRIAEAINGSFGDEIAQADDGGTVTVNVPASAKGQLVPFISKLENLEINPQQKARVVINERTGTLVAGADVQIQPATVSHNGMTLTFGHRLQGAADSNSKDAAPGAPLQSGELLSEATTAEEIAAGLSALKLSPSDIVAIFEALAAAGALTAELELI